MPQVGDKAPDFTLPSTEGPVTLSQFARGKKVVLAFYTEDNTPSCSRELASFREEYATLREMGAEVLAVSADSLDSHRSFCDVAGGYPFPLASDAQQVVARLYDVLSEDGTRSRRAVFVLDEGGAIIYANPWYQPGNPAQLLEVFQALGLKV
ncbi:MAG: peroxiredoxin [Chloroflexi bacterium]|nr:peroxiredoxin [Chloroflexota bacterium]